jgi:hypothetical protein
VSDINTDAGFEEYVARQAEAQTADDPEAESAQPYDPAGDTPSEILAGVLDPQVGSPTVREGLTVEGGPQPTEYKLSPENQALLDKLEREEAADVARVQADLDEVEYRRALDVVGDYEATDEERLAALLNLREKAPDMYVGFLRRMDDEVIDRLAEIDPEGDLDESRLPGTQVDEIVNLADAHLRRAQSEEMIGKLKTHIASKQVEAIRSAFEAEGVTDPSEVAELWLIHRELFAQIGLDPFSLEPHELKGAIEVLNATSEELASEQRKTAFRSELLNAPDTSISAGLEVLGPNGYMPLQPRPSPFVSSEGREHRIVARATAKNRPMTKGEFRRAIVEPERATLRYTTDDGTPISVDDATGARERHERDQRERRARALAFLPVKAA